MESTTSPVTSLADTTTQTMAQASSPASSARTSRLQQQRNRRQSLQQQFGMWSAASPLHSNSSTVNRQHMTSDSRGQQHPVVVIATSPQPAPTEPTSRSSISTVDSEGRVGASSLRRMSKRWTTLETAGRFMFALSFAFLVTGVTLTAVGFATDPSSGSVPGGTLAMQITGPVCLATTGVMWALGIAFSRLWRAEWRRRQQAMELRARVQLHALAMDLLNKPILSPRVLQDPVLRRQLLVKLRQQSAMDVSSVETGSTRRSSRVLGGHGEIPPIVGSATSVGTSSTAAAARRHRDSVISAILRQEIERRKSLKDVADGTGAEKLTPAAALAAAAAAFELPGIHISRIETMDIEDDETLGSRRGGFMNGLGSRRFIIIESDLSSGDFSQLSFTSEYSLTGNGSRSSRSRSSRASSNVSSRLWDFSPRESEWEADVSHGSRESQLSSTVVSKADWGGGPSYGGCGGAGRGRDYSLLSPAMPRKGSVVTFDVGEPGVRRHSSPVPPARRRSSAAVGAVAGGSSGAATADVGQGHAPASAMKSKDVIYGSSLLSAGLCASGYGIGGSGTTSGNGGNRYLEDYRTLNQFRKRSAGDQSIISIRIDEDDSGEELEERRLGIEEQMVDRGPEEDEDDEEDDIDNHDSDDERTPLNVKLSSSDDNRKSCTSDEEDQLRHASKKKTRTTMSCELQQQAAESMNAAELLLKRRRSSMKRNDTDDSEVARRVARIFEEIDYSAAESVDESKLIMSHSSVEASSNVHVGGSIDDSGGDVACGSGSRPMPRVGSTTRRASFKGLATSAVIGSGKSRTMATMTSSSMSSGNDDVKSWTPTEDTMTDYGESSPKTSATSSGSRKFRLLSSIPRAIFSLERRSFGGHPTRKRDDESVAPSRVTDCTNSTHSKSNRLLVSLGLCDDSHT